MSGMPPIEQNQPLFGGALFWQAGEEPMGLCQVRMCNPMQQTTPAAHGISP